MPNHRYLLFIVLLLSSLLAGCTKEDTSSFPTKPTPVPETEVSTLDTLENNSNPNPNPPPPSPDLCAEIDQCDDGIFEGLLKTWNPVGGIFEGQNLVHGCIDTLCPDIQFTFQADSTYFLKMTSIVQDSSGVVAVETIETGTYRVQDCYCVQYGTHYDGFKIDLDGKILFAPDGGDTYEIGFTYFSGGIFLYSSTRDSTLTLFLD